MQFTGTTTKDIQGVLRYIHQDILKHAVIAGWDCPENFTTGGSSVSSPTKPCIRMVNATYALVYERKLLICTERLWTPRSREGLSINVIL